MKNLLFCTLVSLTILGCNQPPPDTSKSDAAKALYEKNLATIKAAIRAFENEQIDSWASNIADDAVWNSNAYGSAPGTKEDYKKVLTLYMADWDSLKLNNPIYLPGLDSATHEMDGSVRYYGTWVGVHKSGVRTSVNFYSTLEYNTENKISNVSDFFDVGGMMNAVNPKK